MSKDITLRDGIKAVIIMLFVTAVALAYIAAIKLGLFTKAKTYHFSGEHHHITESKRLGDTSE